MSDSDDDHDTDSVANQPSAKEIANNEAFANIFQKILTQDVTNRKVGDDNSVLTDI